MNKVRTRTSKHHVIVHTYVAIHGWRIVCLDGLNTVVCACALVSLYVYVCASVELTQKLMVLRNLCVRSTTHTLIRIHIPTEKTKRERERDKETWRERERERNEIRFLSRLLLVVVRLLLALVISLSKLRMNSIFECECESYVVRSVAKPMLFSFAFLSFSFISKRSQPFHNRSMCL